MKNIFTRMFNKKGFTGVIIACTNKLNSQSAVKVYNLGNGPFVYNYVGDDFRYLMIDGSFEGEMPVTSVNGDYVSWKPHDGHGFVLDFSKGESK